MDTAQFELAARMIMTNLNKDPAVTSEGDLKGLDHTNVYMQTDAVKYLPLATKSFERYLTGVDVNNLG